MHQLSKQLVADVDRDLARLRATCRLASKSEPRTSWETVRTGIGTFEGALGLVSTYSEAAYEVAIFLEHDSYGGIMVWSSSEPDVANRFSDYSI